MKKLAEGDFELLITSDSLVFRTASYRAERGSILSRAIFTPELASMMAALVAALLTFAALGGKGGAIQSAMALFAFAVWFIVFRTVVFGKGKRLELRLDRQKNSAVLRVPFRRQRVFGLDAISDVQGGAVDITPENPEGIKLVEKIALHHGTVLPDFDTPLRLYTVGLHMKDGGRIDIYATKDKNAVADVTLKIREFLAGKG